jgi:hypothetical protein
LLIWGSMDIIKKVIEAFVMSLDKDLLYENGIFDFFHLESPHNFLTVSFNVKAGSAVDTSSPTLVLSSHPP